MVKNDPKSAAKGLIFFKGKYLLLLRDEKEDIELSTWDIPGGGIEKGEIASEALIREIKEETGINISSCKISPIKNWILQKKEIRFGGVDFLCILENYQKIKLSSEHFRAKWFDAKEIMDSEEIPSWLKESVKLAAAKINKL